jgi:hypothetical protein
LRLLEGGPFETKNHFVVGGLDHLCFLTTLLPPCSAAIIKESMILAFCLLNFVSHVCFLFSDGPWCLVLSTKSIHMCTSSLDQLLAKSAVHILGRKHTPGVRQLVPEQDLGARQTSPQFLFMHCGVSKHSRVNSITCSSTCPNLDAYLRSEPTLRI